MADVRLIDANSVCKKIAESIRHAEEWANESKEQQDTHGLRCATEVKTSLLAMLARIHDEPTVEAEPVNSGWISVDDRLPEDDGKYMVWYKGELDICEFDTDSQTFGYTHDDYDEFYSYLVYWDDGMNKDVTYWRPLPEPPKGE